MKMNKETYTCSICNAEINTPGSKMMIDRDEELRVKGTLCVDCYGTVSRDDPFVLLQAIEYSSLVGIRRGFRMTTVKCQSPREQRH